MRCYVVAQPKPEPTSLDQVLKLASKLTLAEQQALRKELNAKSFCSNPEADSGQQQDVLPFFNRQLAIKYLKSRLANQSVEDQSWDDIKRALNAERLSGRKLFDA
jgi:hypothetical protein